ncbi:4Fe-4S binding domain protein [Candidatus Neoehrlichia lotoris str. RAC413]|uniref:Ferredoxin n=2 Tax=Candidatus Neoehrlichia procyonis TaxID=467750 RepID=A0A0F3NMT1_9RICK|nr:4Fe-4S binding domain protein [Candidatus Neoehrlichia lotoris str. RAC413]
MLVIDPEQCIDCGVCIPECPIDAIVTDDAVKDILQCQDDTLNEEQKKLKTFYNINAEFSKKWENITSRKTAMSNADKHKHEKNKIQYFSENIT